MAKTEAEQKFDYLVSKAIWPHFKAMDYKKSGNNIRFFDEKEGWGKIVDFQKSNFYSKDHIHFTINIGLHLEEYCKQIVNKPSSGKFMEYQCMERHRLGDLTDTGDVWFDVKEYTDIETLSAQIESLIKEHVIPYLAKYNSRSDIIKLLFDRPGGLLRIKTLFSMEHRDLALSALEEEIEKHTDEQYLKKLFKTKEEFDQYKI